MQVLVLIRDDVPPSPSPFIHPAQKEADPPLASAGAEVEEAAGEATRAVLKAKKAE